jgi:hypothetical protein
MKKNNLKLIGASIIVLTLLFGVGCDDNDPGLSPIEELSSEAKSFLGMRNGATQSLSANGNSSMAINKSFQGAYGGYASVSGSVTATEGADSTVIEPYPGGWVSCAVYSETANPDGSTTYTTDYGDGCEEGSGDYKYFMHGKNSYTYKYGQSQNGSVFKYTYFSHFVSENFGGSNTYDGITYEWLNNGHSTYSGESEYDSIDQSFSGFYAYSDTSEYLYDGLMYTYKSIGNTSYDGNKSVTESNNYEYTYGSDYYKSIVLSPLVRDYTCNSGIGNGNLDGMMMPFYSTYVSGREKVNYIRDGAEGEFEIDYGNGECDNIIVIYENGKVFSIDLSTDYAMIAKGG